MPCYPPNAFNLLRYSPMLALMKRNLALNPSLMERCLVGELNWGERVPEGIPKQPDILLLADCVYLEVAFQPLVDTLKEMAMETTEILVSCHGARPY
jgi:predicted nicotinamide N-methyase